MGVIKHGATKTKEYKSWTGMMHRCYVPTDISYPNYGGRGIRVCRRWHEAKNFLEDMGPRPAPGMSLDRKDNNKGYSKANCIWSDRKTQNRNRRGNRMITYKGKTQCLRAWCEELGLKYARTYSRLFTFKQPVEKAFTGAFYARAGS